MKVTYSSKDELLSKIKACVAEERQLMLEVLHYLREIERTRLFAELGYSSLHAFCVQELRYSDGAAARRINSMRVLRELPELKEKIESGSLSLCTISTVQHFSKAEGYSKEEKASLLERVEGLSKRECERVLVSISPESAKRESVRAVTQELTEIRFTADEALMKKLERIQELSGQTGYAELLHKLADTWLKKHEPEHKPEPEKDATPPVERESTTRYIPAAIRRAVWTHDQGRCTYKDPKTGRSCGSKHALQIDHIRPYALGGSSDLKNLRLLCRAHNQLAAIQAYGPTQMTHYIPNLK